MVRKGKGDKEKQYLGNNVLDDFLLTLHGKDRLQLTHVDGFPPATADNLIKGQKNLHSHEPHPFLLFSGPNVLTNNSGKQSQRLHVLQNIAGLAGHQDQIMSLQWLINKTDFLCLHKRVLLT